MLSSKLNRARDERVKIVTAAGSGWACGWQGGGVTVTLVGSAGVVGLPFLGGVSCEDTERKRIPHGL